MGLLDKIDSYLQINENVGIQLGTPYIYKYKGKWIIDTKHSKDRRYHRAKEGQFVLSEDQMTWFFRKIIDYCLKNEGKWKGLYETEMLFFSKKLNQGIIVTYRQDKMVKSNEKHVVIITYLPKGKDKPKSGTLKVITESKELQYILDYITNNHNKIDCYECVNIIDDFKITSYWQDNKLLDLSIPVEILE